MSDLAEWGNFYLIIGGAAGALIGLQFVVLTLISQRPRTSAPEAGAAFATPNIVHFVAALLLSAVLVAPWRSMGSPAVLWGLLGLCGVVYSGIVSWRMRAQNLYEPVFEDWFFHFVLPFLSYALLSLASLTVLSRPRESLFAVALAALLFLGTGIHNSWDAITWHVFSLNEGIKEPDAESGEEPAESE